MGSGEKSSSGGSSSWTESATEYYDPYNTGIKSARDIEKLSPDEQLKCVLEILKAGDHDTAYAFFEGMQVLKDISNDDRLPPLLRIMARGGEKLDPNSPGSLEDEPDWLNDETLKSTYGYSSVVSPDMMPNVLTEEEEAMSEDEIKEELRQLSRKMADMSKAGASIEEWEEYYNCRGSLEFALRRLYFLENQGRLHREFPELPKEKQLVKIASDAAAAVDFEERYDDELFPLDDFLELISTSDGQVVPASELNTLLDTESNVAAYPIMLHNSEQIKSIIGVDLVDLPLKSQAQLLKFMAESTGKRFDHLCDTLQKINSEDLRRKLLGNFVAVDFGEDFGDALLEIASSERLSSKQVEGVLDQVSSCRRSIGEITGLYDGFDNGEFAKEYTRAANERLTDALMAFREIVRRGIAGADLGWFGRADFDFDGALEALTYETRSLEIISGTLRDVEQHKEGVYAEIVLKPDEQRGRTLYNFYSPEHGYVLLYTRPEGSGSFDSMLEYGKVAGKYDFNSYNSGVEASISLITNPVDPFSRPNPFRPDRRAAKNPAYYDSETMDKVSAIRLDREGRVPGAKADDPNRNPINAEGTISVDLAAINDRADTPSGKIARLISVGNMLRAEGAGGNSSLNHNTKWFD